MAAALRTMQNALNSLLDLTIQESELHKSFAEEIKSKVLQPLHEIRIKLSKEKENWLYAINALKTNLTASQEKLKQEQQRLKSINLEIDKIKERKRKAMEAIGLDPMEEIAFDNLPEDIKKLEKAIIDRTRAKREIADSCESSSNSASQAEEHYKARLKRILCLIEQDESLRIKVVRKALTASNDVFVGLKQSELRLGEIASKSYGRISAVEDVQGFIRKSSLCSTNEEELKILYRSLGEDLRAGNTKKTPESKKQSEAERMLAEKAKRDWIALKQLRSRAGKQERVHDLYPSAPLLREAAVHSDLRQDDAAATGFLLYAAHEFAAVVDAKVAFAKNPFRPSKEDRPSGSSPSVLGSPEFSKRLGKYFKITEEQKALASTFIEGIEVAKTDALQSMGLHSFFLHVLKRWTGVLAAHAEVTDEFEVQVHKQLYSLIWAYIFWQIFAKVDYKDEEFDQECVQVMQMIQFNSYMAEASLVRNTQFAEFTLEVLEKLQERCSLKPSLPFSLKFFNSLAPLIIEEDGKELVRDDFGQLVDEAKLIYEMLGIEMEWACVFLLKYIADTCIPSNNYAERNERQGRGLKGMVKIKRHVESNYKEAISKSLETAAELRGNIEKAGIVLSLAESFSESLASFKKSFGECANKLKAVLELNGFLHGIVYFCNSLVASFCLMKRITNPA